MSTNPLNDISKVYLDQVASQEVEEGYQPIGREKESAMYRRAGNLARKSLASTGKTKLAAAKKSATIVGAITRQKERERFDSIGQSPSHNEEAKPDYLDFDKDGNKNEPMKKALRDKAKQKMQEAKKPNDGNLANNYPPYDKVTRGDVIAGRLGKDQMGGKKRTVKEGFSNWREELIEVADKIETKTNQDQKIVEKQVSNKIVINPKLDLGEAIKNLGGTLLEMEEIDEKITAKTDMGMAIKDFYTSKSPQLAGRTKEERRKAAIAAVLTARRGGKKMEEQAVEVPPKTQQQTQPEKPNPAVAAKQRQMINLQKQIELKKLAALSRGVPLSQSYEPEGEVVEELSPTQKDALAAVKAGAGPGLMTGKTKKPEATKAQKAAAQKASADYVKRTSEYLYSSPRD